MDNASARPSTINHRLCGKRLRWRVEAVVSLMILLAIGAMLAWGLMLQRKIILAENERELTSLAQLAESRLSANMRAVSRMLSTLAVLHEADRLPQADNPLDFWRPFELRLPQGSVLIVTNAQGIVIASSLPALVAQDISQLEVFKEARQANNNGKLIVSADYLLAPQQDETIGLAKRVISDGGLFKGMVLINVPLPYYEKILAGFRTGSTRSVALFRSNGDFLARSPPTPSSSSSEQLLAQGGTLLAKHLQTGKAVSFQRYLSVSDHLEKLGAASTINLDGESTRPELVVAVAEQLSVALKPWRDLTYTVWGYAAMLAVALWLGWSNFQRTRDNEHYADLVEALMTSPEVLVLGLDEHERVVLFNETAAQLCGYAPADILGKNWFDLPLNAAMADPRTEGSLRDLLRQGQIPITYESVIVARDGGKHYIAWHNSVIRKKGHLQLVAFGRDVTVHRVRESKLTEEAQLDPLTGIANRRHLLALGERHLAHARRRGSSLTALMVDADHFKSINDRFGHATGDIVLRRLAEIGSSILRSEDTMGRLGGEEFAIFLANSDLATAHHVAQRLSQAIREMQVVSSQGEAIKCTVSIGIAELAPEDRDCEAMLRRADEALYAAKESGRDKVVVAGKATHTWPAAT